MAQALKNGYREIFERNEYANNLTKDQLKGMVVEVTGLDSKNRVVNLICQTFETLKTLANFEAPAGFEDERGTDGKGEEAAEEEAALKNAQRGSRDIDLNLAYTINLVLPKSDDPAVFNAIFKALRENLLKR
jgi:hypothetical protein